MAMMMAIIMPLKRKFRIQCHDIKEHNHDNSVEDEV